MNTGDSIQYRMMTRDDLAAVAELHAEVFPTYFLTSLGPRFLTLFYGQFADQPRAYGCVAIHAGRLVGFIVGALDMPALERRFYRRHIVQLAWLALVAFVRDGTARRGILARMSLARKAAAALLPSARTRSAEGGNLSGNGDETPGSLVLSSLSIAVSPSMRGTGIGQRLNENMWHAARADGAIVVKSSVLRSNQVHVERKMRAGWRILRSDDRKITFGLDLVAGETCNQEGTEDS